MQFLTQYGLFLAKTVTLVVAILIVISSIIALRSKDKGEENGGKLKIKNLNKKYAAMRDKLQEEVLDKSQLKKEKKAQKKLEKSRPKDPAALAAKHTIFVLEFHGDVRAQAVAALREEITALLTVAKPGDEVMVNVESAGGMVHAYGLAASQLQRIKQQGLKLTVCVDKVAASGGYLMACVADTILAAPFAIIGSIGVIAQLPNFHRLLKDKHIDFEQLTAGQYKRTLTMFGENTNKGREKFQEQIEEIHTLFKDFVKTNRTIVNIDQVATGEYWYGKRALELKLIDEITTSDDYLLSASKTAHLFELTYKPKRNLANKLFGTAQQTISELPSLWQQAQEEQKYL